MRSKSRFTRRHLLRAPIYTLALILALILAPAIVLAADGAYYADWTGFTVSGFSWISIPDSHSVRYDDTYQGYIENTLLLKGSEPNQVNAGYITYDSLGGSFAAFFWSEYCTFPGTMTFHFPHIVNSSELNLFVATSINIDYPNFTGVQIGFTETQTGLTYNIVKTACPLHPVEMGVGEIASSVDSSLSYMRGGYYIYNRWMSTDLAWHYQAVPDPSFPNSNEEDQYAPSTVLGGWYQKPNVPGSAGGTFESVCCI